MIRLVFLTLLSAVLIGSCARMEQRAPRYDPTECPFCAADPGECGYCGGTGKCTFCNGTGLRQTGTPAIPEEGIEKGSYEEKCPYCGGSGVCRYCRGKATCWACDGTAKVESWDFFEKWERLMKESPMAKALSAPVLPRDDSATAENAAPVTGDATQAPPAAAPTPEAPEPPAKATAPETETEPATPAPVAEPATPATSEPPAAKADTVAK